MSVASESAQTSPWVSPPGSPAATYSPPSHTKSVHSAPSATIETLDALQSLEQRHLLNEIDKLRAYGINDFVSLPQIVVCGDQSSGKSSVLEAITEIPFPRKDNLCTRFATQIVLRRAAKTRVLVKILPDSKRPEHERKRLEEFTATLENFKELPSLIEGAQEVMGIGTGSSAFSRDVLSIEISGPDRPQLTVVDLPGLTHTENKSQSRFDVELVSDLVQKYMSDPRTIILAIVTAKNDYANQIVLKRAKEVDLEGVRTLGIITKPDTLPEGSDSEDDFFSLAKNEDIFFKLGWHVLRNRNYEERDTSFEYRNRTETAFFEKSVWKSLPRECIGISALRSRLSALLLNRIKQELPRVSKEITDGLRDCENQLSKLGQARSTVDEQRIFLSEASETFGRLCKAATDGIYESEFFGDAMGIDGQVKRLRAVVQNFNNTFAENIRKKGHSKEIVDDPSAAAESGFGLQDDHPHKITRKEAIEWVKPLLLRSRGRELPGTYNPLLIGEVFWEQSKPWESIANTHLKHIFQICQKFLRLVLQEIVPGDVLQSLFAYWIDDKMQERFDKAESELKSITTDRRRHAITYNHYCTDTMQRARAQRLEERYIAAICSVSDWDPKMKNDVVLNPLDLLKALTVPNEENMDDYACEEVLDGMFAFYKVASKVFVDNVAIQVIERQVVGSLWEIFSPSAVATMTPEMVSNVAEESMEDLRLREQLEAKRKSLQMGVDVCRGALKGFKAEFSTRTSQNNTRTSSFKSSYGGPMSTEEITALIAGTNIEGQMGKKVPENSYKSRTLNTPTKPPVAPTAPKRANDEGAATANRPVADPPFAFTTTPRAMAATGPPSGGLFGGPQAGPSNLFGGAPKAPPTQTATKPTSWGLFSNPQATTGAESTSGRPQAAPITGLFGTKGAPTGDPGTWLKK